MASVNLSGVLLNPEGFPDVGAIVKFTLVSTTGDTVKSSVSELIVPPDGAYNIDLVYGLLRVDYISGRKERFVAVVTVNADTVATSLPELLSASTPPTNAQLLQFQNLLADAVAAKDDSITAKDQAEAAAASVVLITTTGLINSNLSVTAGTITDTLGYAANGDGGGAKWLATATTGLTPSQSPATRGAAELVDATGRLWQGVSGTTADDFASFEGLRNQGFWANSGGFVRRYDNRVFIDDAIVNTGDSPATQRTWLGQQANGFMTYYDTRSSQEVISSIGGIGIATGSRTSDNNRAGERNTIGLASYTLNDGSANTAWGIYGHSVLGSEDSVATFVAELNIANTATTLTEVTPYSLGTAGATSALRLRSGGETAESGVPCKPASAALDIAHPQISEATFNKGIVVQNGSISSSAGIDGNAIFVELPTNMRYQWKFGSTTADLGGFMSCNTTAAGSVAGINFNNSGLDFCQSDGTGLVRFNPTSNAIFPTTTDTTSLGLTNREYKEVNSKLYKTDGGQVGVSGFFTTTDGKSVTVTNGIITSIV